MALRKHGIAITCIVIGIVLAACGPGNSPTASITPAGQTAAPAPTAIVMPSTVTPTPAWAIFPRMPATPYTVDALYQSFEHGFMVWRSDANCVYALKLAEDTPGTFHAVIPSPLLPYSYCLTVDPLAVDRETVEPPAGYLLPTGVLGQIWSFYPEIQTGLGFALQPASSYLATIPVVNDLPVQDGLVFAIPQMTLPDGHILACGARGASAGTCFWNDME